MWTRRWQAVLWEIPEEGAKAAAEALKLVESLQGKPVTKEDLAQLEELRARAWQSDKSGEAGKYCDTLAKVLLLRPMMEKLETVQPEARAQLADVLHTQLDRLLSVTTQEQVEQIRSELRGTLELYRQEGMLGPEQNAAFDRLDELLSYREECMTTLAKLQKSAEQVRNGEASAPQLGNVLNDVEALRDNRMKAESPVPPLRPGFQPLQIEAEMLASDLYLFSKEKAGEFSRRKSTTFFRHESETQGIPQENVGKEERRTQCGAGENGQRSDRVSTRLELPKFRLIALPELLRYASGWPVAQAPCSRCGREACNRAAA